MRPSLIRLVLVEIVLGYVVLRFVSFLLFYITEYVVVQ